MAKKMQLINEGAKSAYKNARKHLYRTLDGLDDRHATYRPTPEARNILNICRHIGNADIYWLGKVTGEFVFSYVPEEVSLKQMKETFVEVENYMLKKLEEFPLEEITITPPQGKEKPPSLHWIAFRVSQHCLGHSAQIAYLRSIQDAPPRSKEGSGSWQEGTDVLIKLVGSLIESQ